MTFDLLFFVFVAAGVAGGAWKGLAWQLAGIGSIALGVALGVPLTIFVLGGIEGPTLFTQFLVFAACYAGISLGCYAVALLLRRKLEQIRLERYDRHMGAFAGAIHGLALWSLLVMFLVAMAPDAREPILTRPTGRIVGHALDVMHEMLPDELHEVLHPYMHPGRKHSGETEPEPLTSPEDR